MEFRELSVVLTALTRPTAAAASRWPRTSQHEQVAGDDPESDPTFHPGLASISTSAEPLTALHGTDAAFAPGAPPQPAAIPALARRARPARPRRPATRQDHPRDAEFARRAFVGRRRKPRVGDGQARRVAKQGVMPLERRHPQRLVGHARWADVIVGDDSWIFTTSPNSVGLAAFPLRITSVCGSKMLRILSG